MSGPISPVLRWSWLALLAACGAPSAAGPRAAQGPAPGAGSAWVADDAGGGPPGAPAGFGPGKLHLERGPVGGGCPAERHARCLGALVETFDIDARPATEEEYARCVAAGRCPAYGPDVDGEEGTRGPGLTVEAADRYCAWRGERLPIEGEWERARLEAKGFELPAPPAIKEVLVGWYTWFGPAWTEAPPPQYNSRLVIRVLEGESYRYGNHARRPTPDLAFRCVRSKYRPPADPAEPAIAR